MKHAGLTHSEVKCTSMHTNEMQKLCVCCVVHMPQHCSGRITFMGKKQGSLQSPFRLPSPKFVRKELVSVNCDDNF